MLVTLLVRGGRKMLRDEYSPVECSLGRHGLLFDDRIWLTFRRCVGGGGWSAIYIKGVGNVAIIRGR
jgi:hypothetical protein